MEMFIFWIFMGIMAITYVGTMIWLFMPIEDLKKMGVKK